MDSQTDIQSKQEFYVLSIKRVKNVVSDKVIQNQEFFIRIDMGGNIVKTATKSGDDLEWVDVFKFNLEDYVQDGLTFTLYADQQQVGTKNLPYKRIRTEFLSLGRKEVILQKGGKAVGVIEIIVDYNDKESIIGGIDPPKICLRPEIELPQSFLDVEMGLQIKNPAKRNLFSCLDQNSNDFEFFPHKFVSKKDARKIL